ncbi:MAG: raffinose/stachyose/melibiose transport system permease protein [Gaiellales bacterium]|jgi:raffinose/stachyose/melibiose transport system permease protein|nr:raffinose/stachyose/melibiose transport system permease protein [Gaiellales bacterium]
MPVQRLGRGARHAILTIVTLSALLPVYVMISSAFRTQAAVLDQPLGFPTSPTLHGFSTALNDQFPRWLLNSFIVTGGSVVLCMLFASMAAFGLVRFDFWGRDLVLGSMIALMVIPPVVLVIPLFSLGVQLNLINTFRFVILIYVGLMLPFSIYMLWSFFRTIPAALLEAATVDGANSLQIFLRVVLPLSGAPLVTLAVVNVLWAWNELLFALIFLQSDSSHTVMAGLTAFQNRYTLDIPVVMAGLSLATLPIVAVYLLGQRYFTRGLVAGAIK